MKKLALTFSLLMSFPLLSVEQEKPQELQNKDFLKSLGLDTIKGGVAIGCAAISYFIASSFLKQAMHERAVMLEDRRYDGYRYQDQDGAIRINTSTLPPLYRNMLSGRRNEWFDNHSMPAARKATIPAILYISASTAAVWYGCKLGYKTINFVIKKQSKIKSDITKGLIALTASLVSIYKLTKLNHEYNERCARINNDPRFVMYTQGPADTRQERLENLPDNIDTEFRIKNDDLIMDFLFPALVKSITPAIVAVTGTAATLWYSSEVGYELIKENKSKQNNSTTMKPVTS